MIDANQYYIINIDDKEVVSKGYTRWEDADEAATTDYGDDYWTNSSPYAVWLGKSILETKFINLDMVK